eukprot:1393727-Rhodomonas_salina.2
MQAWSAAGRGSVPHDPRITSVVFLQPRAVLGAHDPNEGVRARGSVCEVHGRRGRARAVHELRRGRRRVLSLLLPPACDRVHDRVLVPPGVRDDQGLCGPEHPARRREPRAARARPGEGQDGARARAQRPLLQQQLLRRRVRGRDRAQRLGCRRLAPGCDGDERHTRVHDGQRLGGRPRGDARSLGQAARASLLRQAAHLRRTLRRDVRCAARGWVQRGLEGRGRVRSVPERETAQSALPVSYTHLTLPTICSV